MLRLVHGLTSRDQLNLSIATGKEIDYCIGQVREAKTGHMVAVWTSEAMEYLCTYRRIPRAKSARRPAADRERRWANELATATLVARGTIAAAAQTADELASGARVAPGPLAQEAYRKWYSTTVCPECGVPWADVSPDCPRRIRDLHPGAMHDDGRRY